MNSKICVKCGIEKDYSEFHKHKQCLGGYNTVCKECRKPLSKENYKNSSNEYKMWNAAKHRAKKKGIEFTLELKDIVIPEICPVFGTKFVSNTEYTASLDRFDSKLGYTKENTRVISYRANMLKNNATIEELQDVIEYMQGWNCM